MGRRPDEPYEAVPHHSGFWPYKVVKKDDPNTILFVEHKKKCIEVAELLNVAYRTGRCAGLRGVL